MNGGREVDGRVPGDTIRPVAPETARVWNRLSVFRKGLVLTAAPLLVQLAFVAVIADMERSTARAVGGSIHSAVDVAYTGPGGVELARRAGPDVVLCDIGLPGLDGYAVARRIREEAAGKRPVLVALTGYGEDDDRRKAREAGFDHHFTKPADPEVIGRLLGSVA